MNGLRLMGIASIVLGSLIILGVLGLTSLYVLLGLGFLSAIGLIGLIPGVFFVGLGWYLYQMGSKAE